MSVNLLENSIEYLKGVGPKRAIALREGAGIETFYDLLTYYPFRYIDRSKFYYISDINSETAYIQIKGKIIKTEVLGTGRSARFTAILSDNTGQVELVWFQGQKWIRERIIINNEYIVFGKPAIFNGKYNFTHPDLDAVGSQPEFVGETLQGVYFSTEKMKNAGFNSKSISKCQRTLLNTLKNYIPEILSQEIIDKLKLLARELTFENIHFPQNNFTLERAQFRLKFEEFFFLQLKLFRNKNIRLNKLEGLRFPIVGNTFNEFYKNHLPFELTNAQKKVMKEIRADLNSGKQMNRLLQGDVGSGKTLVALMTCLIAIDNGFQACMMVPTEILSQQHFRSFLKFLNGLDIHIELLTGSVKASKRKKILNDVSDGSIQILIGTHSLIEDKVIFKNLGFVIIDEQHRFGVEQRAKLWSKNNTIPHILVMTATPIPRTLSMTLYGDLDISVIDELPPGRKPIKTYHFFEPDRNKVYNFILKQIQENRQVYIVFPLILESETLDLKYLDEGFQTIKSVFKDVKSVELHGKMTSIEKEANMKSFVDGDARIMVATTVIEVGVDVPNATVMMIENANRFGLSQLHQLRGRIGRGGEQSHCILMTEYKLSEYAKLRLNTMVRTNDGFEIAEADLRLRGPGDMEGTQQSGIIDLKIADIIKDEKILRIARNIAQDIINEDPLLEDSKNIRLKENLFIKSNKKKNFGLIS